MRTRPAVILFLAAMVLTACSRNAGIPKNPLATPEETVQAYCDLDAQGVRLTSSTWSKVLPYIAWTEEAGSDRAVVIEGFSIGKVRKKGDRDAAVNVEYRVLGTVSDDYAAGRRTETVSFTLARTDRGWKITEPDLLPPHVEMRAMVKHLEATKQIETAGKMKGAEK